MRYSYVVSVYGTGCGLCVVCRLSVCLFVTDVLWLNGAR